VTADDVEDRLAEEGEIGAVAAGFEFGGQRGLAAFGEGAGPAHRRRGRCGATTGLAAAGDGSESHKRDALFGLFNRCEPAEAKVIARLVLGEMRLGVGEGAVRDAIAEAFLAGNPEGDERDESDTDDDPILRAGDEAVVAVERALQVTNDRGRVAVPRPRWGLNGLRAEGLAVGRPVQAMLAQAGTATDAVEAFGEVAVETKFDGARVQVHYVCPSRPPRATTLLAAPNSARGSTRGTWTT